jgi:hypothetical protein
MKSKLTAALMISFVFGLTASIMASEPYKPPPEREKPVRITIQDIYHEKCARCHDISRSESASKDMAGWERTVTRMQRKDPSWISKEQGEDIASWLAGRGLCRAKCGKCHDLSRIDVRKTVPQWQTTVNRMQSKDPAWISDGEKDLIIFYLTDVDLLVLE